MLYYRPSFIFVWFGHMASHASGSTTFMSFDIDKIAHLSRIALTEEDREALGPKLANIVAFIDQLQTADTQGIDAMHNPLDFHQRCRLDCVTETDARSKYQAIAPQVTAGLYLVPKVID